MTADAPRRDRGSTLIELLAITAIVGILVAIALPTMLVHRERGHRAAATADLRNAVMAQYAYGTANDGWATDPAALASQGYRQTSGVTPVHLRVDGDHFTACLRHESMGGWLVYDSATATVTDAAGDCVS